MIASRYIYRDTGRHAEAEPLYERAIAILEKSLPADHPTLATVRENYAVLLDELGRAAEAAGLRAKAGPPPPGARPRDLRGPPRRPRPRGRGRRAARQGRPPAPTPASTP